MESPNRSVAGKICLVTGATSGIGRATALGLAKRGATVEKYECHISIID